MGHLVRSLELARALSDHDVTLIAGGQEVDMDLPSHARLLRLPVLYMDEKFTQLIPGTPGQSVDQIQYERKKTIYSLMEKRQPDLFIVELYPFGRSMFGFELEPLLADIRKGRFGQVKVVCSLRDILVEKKDPSAYEDRVIQKLNRHFDALLIHSVPEILSLDETFSRVADINIPLVYTGFITQQTDAANGSRLRTELSLSSAQKFIVASAGGGRSGHRLLTSVIDACELLRDRLPIRLQVFTGPFMDKLEYENLTARTSAGIRIRRYTKRFLDYLYAADLSVSLAGYNTCMNLLVTGVPALVYPYSRQQEQPLRANRIKELLPVKILNNADIQPVLLSKHIDKLLNQPRTSKPSSVDFDGAANAADFLDRWVDESIKL